VCFVLNRLKLHILVVHLHAHSSIDREAEATYIQTQIIEGVIEEKYGAGAFIAIMGDMNSLSSVDAKHHEELGLVQTMSTFEPQVSTHLRHIVERGRICVYVMDVFLQVSARYIKKYLTLDRTAINYKPIDILMR
jgi:hypothetical protein